MHPPRSRRGGFRFQWTTTRIIIAVNLVVFLLQPLLLAILGNNATNLLLLSAASIKAGYIWTIVTYSFLHASFFHLLGNMIGLWCMGEFIDKSEGRARLLTVYAGGILAGAAAWLTLSFLAKPGWNVPCLGASAGVFALLAYALFKLYNEPIRIFIYFILPLTLRSKWVLAGLAVITLGGLFLWEIPATTGWWPVSGWLADTLPIAHSAHLGGMLWGAAVFAWAKLRAGNGQKVQRKLQPLRQTVFVHNTNKTFTGHNSNANPGNITPFTRNDPEYLRAEADRILDKMNAEGYKSLTQEERELLGRVGPLYGKK
ncbi:MAG: rhomboid family intramembrane serine protease [Puniceicoccales bacterium]|nr:rhomboid family intramembrane serine protease [Puniceicoccales bacterium]